MTYEVGQTLLRRDVNESRRGGPEQVTVTKVGRKLVYVSRGYRDEAFRIEDGKANDKFGHAWLQTPGEYAAEQERGAVMQRLRALGVTLEYAAPTYPTDVLQRVVDVLTPALPAPTKES